MWVALNGTVISYLDEEQEKRGKEKQKKVKCPKMPEEEKKK